MFRRFMRNHFKSKRIHNSDITVIPEVEYKTEKMSEDIQAASAKEYFQYYC